MKKRINFIWASAICLGLFAVQQPAMADGDDSDSDVGTRFSAGVDKKISKGFHVFAEEEMRLDGLSSFDRFYTTVGTSYKINDYLKIGAGYSAISVLKDPVDASKYWDWRHRGFFDVTGSYRTGSWKFSLRERFQATRMTKDVNTFQQPKTATALRTKLKISYKIPMSGLEPYLAFEHKLALNGAEWDSWSTTSSFASSAYLGHSDVYTSRFRTEGGVEWELNKKNAFDFYCLYDNLTDKNIDSKKTAVLKEAITTVHSSRLAFCVSYVFSF